MSTKTILLLAAVTIVLGFGYLALQHEPHAYRATVIIDKTDSLAVRPDTATLFHTLQWRNDDLSRHVRVREVVDVDGGAAWELDLAAENILFEPATWSAISNGYFRSQAVRQFNERVGLALQEAITGRTVYPRTAFLPVLVDELIRMQGHRGTVYVYSDLQDFDHDLNLATSATARKAMEDDDVSIWEGVPRAGELHDLEGVTVVLIFRARDNENNHRFRVISSYLKRRLEALRATVAVTGKVSNMPAQ